MACGCGKKVNTIKGFKAAIKDKEATLKTYEQTPSLYPASIAATKKDLRSLRAKLAARRRKLQLVAA